MSDLISKEQAIKAMQESEFGFTYEVDVAIEAVKALPSAEPERKKGEWVKDETTYSGSDTYNFVCSECGRIGGSWKRDIRRNQMYPFRPNCGADMTRGEE